MNGGAALPRPVPRRHGASGMESAGLRARAMGPTIPWPIEPSSPTAVPSGRTLASRWPSASNRPATLSSDPDDESIPPRRRDPRAGGLSIDVRSDLLVPEEATRAIVAAAEIGDAEEASRIFDTFARSSVQRDRVLVELVDAGLGRLEAGRHRRRQGPVVRVRTLSGCRRGQGLPRSRAPPGARHRRQRRAGSDRRAGRSRRGRAHGGLIAGDLGRSGGGAGGGRRG